MKKRKKIEPPRWTRQQFVWYCVGCRALKDGKVKVLRLKFRHLMCEPCGKEYMKDVKIINEDSLLNRRYPSVHKSRKEWKCNRCGQLIEKGGYVEHSYSSDHKESFALCLSCSRDLDRIKQEINE